jgi:hypothetical protein
MRFILNRSNTILITYARSSSLSNWKFCQQQYFLTYVLGLERKSSKKADLGTTVHKVMECLALINKQFADTGLDKITFEDSIAGKMIIDKEELLEPRTLSNVEVENINKTRINKSKYCCECQLPYGHIRYGERIVNHLIKKACDRYNNNWSPVDFRDAGNWSWMALEHGGGIYDPRRAKIVDAEPQFEIELTHDWAKYSWNLSNGKILSGNLALKGTIDLIVETDSDTIEIRDWKVGRPVDWSAPDPDKAPKNLETLKTDTQLMLYYYVCKKLYPQYKNIAVTIFYVRYGSPFTVCFNDNIIEEFEHRLKSTYEEIKNEVRPKMLDFSQKNFKCQRICDFYKMKAPDGGNMCRFIHDKIYKVGINKVVKEYTRPGFSIDHYEAPGE